MKDQVTEFGQKVWKNFRAFSPGQKIVTVAAIGALIVGGYFLLAWKPAPTYAPLYTNLAASDASAIVDKLNSAGVPYKLGDGGTEVLVPQNNVYSSRIAMSSAGLPGSGNTGYSLLDKEGVTTSQFKQQVDYQRAIEGELANTIKSINGVNAASVHLAIPQQDVFNDGSQKPTAAVLLTTSAGTTLTAQQVQSVVYLVSSSVPSMTSNDVTVSDSNGNVLAAPGQGVSSAANASTQSQATEAYNNQIAASIQNMLDKAIGPNHAVVTVNSRLNFDQTSTTKKSYVYDKNAPPVSQSQTNEKYKGAGASGAAGTLGSTDTTGATAGSGNGTYDKSSKTVDNALGTVTQTTQNAPGQLQNLSIAVLLDKSVKSLNTGAISQLVKSGVGFNQARGDSLSVQSLPFNNTAQTAATAAAAAATKAAAANAAHDKLMGMVKQGVLVLLILGLIVGAVIAGRRRKGKAVEATNDDVLGLDEYQYQPPRDEDTHLAPVSDLQAAANRRRNLVAAADDRPQDVARVLSSWLSTKES